MSAFADVGLYFFTSLKGETKWNIYDFWGYADML